jgi:hypothetical protein
MADRNPEQVTSSGLEATAHAATAGPGSDTVPGDCTVRVINGGGVSTTLTIATPGVVDGDLAVADRAVATPAGESRYVRVTRASFVDPATGRATLTWSPATSVTFEVIRP